MAASKQADTSVADLRALGATPAILSLEESSAQDIAALLKERNADAVLFAAGAGGKGGKERTRKVDYEGALTVSLSRAPSSLALAEE